MKGYSYRMRINKKQLCVLAVFLLSGGAPTVVDCFSATPTTRTAAATITSKYPKGTQTQLSTTENDVSKLRRYQADVATPLAASFQPSSFNPLPLLQNEHLQTIVATFLRQVPEINYFLSVQDTIQGLLRSTKNDAPQQQFWDSRERFDTPDGDFFHVDYKLHPNGDAKGMVVMCHGLESNSHSNLSKDMALAFYKTGLNVACLNFRGCSGMPNDTLGGYHLGFTNDVLQFLDTMKNRKATSKPIYLSGFSLGANVVLKALGELKMDALSKYNIQGATAFCVPYDAEQNAPFLGSPGFNQIVYCGNLLKTLKQRAQVQLERHCNGDIDTTKFDYEGVLRSKTITDFDQAFVSRIYGFDSAIDYYRKTSCIGFLPDIAVPTFILTARDDPFMDPSLLPVEVSYQGGGPAPIQMVATQHGGHCGYIFQQVESKEEVLETSWSSTELARFFQHLQSSAQTNE